MEFPIDIWREIVSYCKIKPEEYNDYFELNKYYYKTILWEINLYNYRIILSHIVKIKITKKTKCFVWFIMYPTNIETNLLCDYYEYNKEYKIKVDNYDVESIQLKYPNGSITLDSRKKINSLKESYWNNYLKENTIESYISKTLRYYRSPYRKIIVKELLQEHQKYFNIKDETISLLQTRVTNILKGYIVRPNSSRKFNK
jgi:hypothetical protein|tara:strand:- start:346 stop:945 length:600 start_codon:yes stop_codon:yes gene_type:complete